MTDHISKLKAQAETVLAHAHAPYSTFSVGAAILTATGNIYAGCNVENVSSGLTVCAERNAVGAAIAAEGGPLVIQEVYVVNKNAAGESVRCSPCGACRQVLAEFSTAQTRVHYMGSGAMIETTMGDLLPDGFVL
jgi:cytidine deaminase